MIVRESEGWFWRSLELWEDLKNFFWTGVCVCVCVCVRTRAHACLYTFLPRILNIHTCYLQVFIEHLLSACCHVLETKVLILHV